MTDAELDITGKPVGATILAVSRGVCPPAYYGVVTHVCDQAAQFALSHVAWWKATELLDPDGNCKFCGERV